MSSIKSLVIEADGGSRGNPGPAGSGAVLVNEETGQVIFEVARFIGIATNNVAEYTALLAALEIAEELAPAATILVRMDSKLVIEQMAGRWKIKHPDMQVLAARVQRLASKRSIAWQWIPREQNSRADALANRAMDNSDDSDRNLLVSSSQSVSGSSADASSTSSQETKPMAAVAEFNAALPSSVRAPGDITAQLTTVILVRHGRTSFTESKRMSGRGGANPGLSEAGFGDAQKVANEISKIGSSGQWAHLPKPDAIVSSPIQRTLDTANTIAALLNLPVETFAEFEEIGFGEWDGMTHEEAQRTWPTEWSSWQGSWDVAPPNGETLEVFDARIAAGRERLLRDYAGKTVVVVAHVMPIRAFIRAALSGGVETYWRPQIAPCSLTLLRLWGDQAAEVLSVNSTAHL